MTRIKAAARILLATLREILMSQRISVSCAAGRWPRHPKPTPPFGGSESQAMRAVPNVVNPILLGDVQFPR